MSIVERIIKDIKILEGQRSLLMRDLTKDHKMINGSYGLTHRRCGGKNCWCKETQGHPFNRITWKDNNGKSRTTSIKKEDASWIEKTTKNYKAFKKTKRKLIELQKKLKSKIDQLEQKQVDQTRKTRPDLW